MSHVPNFLRTTDRAGGNNLHDESAGFFGPAQIGLETVPIPKPRAGEAVIRVTFTSCKLSGRNSHCLKLSGKANRLPQVTRAMEDQLWAPAFVSTDLGLGVTCLSNHLEP